MTNEELAKETIDRMMDVFQEYRDKLVDDENNNFERSVMTSITLTIIYNMLLEYADTYHEILSGAFVLTSDLNNAVCKKLIDILIKKGVN